MYFCMCIHACPNIISTKDADVLVMHVFVYVYTKSSSPHSKTLIIHMHVGGRVSIR